MWCRISVCAETGGGPQTFLRDFGCGGIALRRCSRLAARQTRDSLAQRAREGDALRAFGAATRNVPGGILAKGTNS